MGETIPVVQHLLDANEQVARENRRLFDETRTFVVNLMSSPGAGKTSLLQRTVPALMREWRVGVIEGDIASRLDAERIAGLGVPVVQINTGGACHLDAPMVRSALAHVDLQNLDVLFVENVGNLICPANFALGAHLNVVLASTPEGHDKPYKYPGMFRAADAVVLNKADLMPWLDFDIQVFTRGLRMVNPRAPLFVLSCKTGVGIDPWVTWLREQYHAYATRGQA